MLHVQLGTPGAQDVFDALVPAVDVHAFTRSRLSLRIVELREALVEAEVEMHAREMCVCHGGGNLVHSRIDA